MKVFASGEQITGLSRKDAEALIGSQFGDGETSQGVVIGVGPSPGRQYRPGVYLTLRLFGQPKSQYVKVG